MTHALAFLAGLALGTIAGILAILSTWPTEAAAPDWREREPDFV